MSEKSVKKTVKKVTKKTAVRGVGRPKGSGAYGVPTKVLRVPAHLIVDVLDFVKKKMKKA
ncbi:MAG: hypothetical protein LBT46_02090 [Planctomycetaceae bacterium]|jgi:hypothetical protein|nr:hypothetical protein [Planctomycetaceae bacterium]